MAPKSCSPSLLCNSRMARLQNEHISLFQSANSELEYLKYSEAADAKPVPSPVGNDCLVILPLLNVSVVLLR